MQAATPFQILQDIDQRCRRNALGLPTGARVEEDWVGIGFQLKGQRLVAKMSDVAEIISPPATIRVPGVKNWVKGLANVRGMLMPILDMGAFLQSEAKIKRNQARILVINKDSLVAGLQVEEVFGLRRFKPGMRSESAHEGMGTLRPYLDGVFTDDATQWSVFSIEKLVKHEPFLRVV